MPPRGGNLRICVLANFTIKWGFSTLLLLTLGQIIFILGGCGGHCPVHCVLFSSLRGHCSLDASISPPASRFPVVTKNISKLCQMSPRGYHKYHPGVRSPAVEDSQARMLKFETLSALGYGTCQGFWTHF